MACTSPAATASIAARARPALTPATFGAELAALDKLPFRAEAGSNAT